MVIAVDVSFRQGYRRVVVANPLVYHILAIPVVECAAACLSELIYMVMPGGGAKSQPKIQTRRQCFLFFIFLNFLNCFFILMGQHTTVALCAFTTAGPIKARSRLECQQRVDSFEKFNIVKTSTVLRGWHRVLFVINSFCSNRPCSRLYMYPSV